MNTSSPGSSTTRSPPMVNSMLPLTCRGKATCADPWTETRGAGRRWDDKAADRERGLGDDHHLHWRHVTVGQHVQRWAPCPCGPPTPAHQRYQLVLPVHEVLPRPACRHLWLWRQSWLVLTPAPALPAFGNPPLQCGVAGAPKRCCHQRAAGAALNPAVHLWHRRRAHRGGPQTARNCTRGASSPAPHPASNRG